MKGSGIFGKLLTAVATLGPLGTRMPAPGTWGSGAGLLFYAVVLYRFNNMEHWATFFAWNVILIAAAIGICTVAEKHLAKKDPGEVIFDEFVAMPLVYIGAESFLRTTSGWIWFFAGFVLFRLFDVLKPLGIKKLQDWPGGLGIVVDDVVAAFASCLVLHVAHWIVLLF
ncbi:MAG: phosphatidylglycerophosphatase A [Puniceicoccales bacterium]|nr:phosphatidylglycerophosphatase A [Puniceicoccales bacterium]